MSLSLPTVPALATIQSRLPVIFPEGLENRTYLVRDIAARTIFVMFYTGAVEGSNRWIRPDQVTKMSDSQSRKLGDSARERWTQTSLQPGRLKHIPGKWYAANTRESIRDETLRMGLIAVGAVIERRGLPTTSSVPRYALRQDFARLFDEGLDISSFQEAVRQWREINLSATALLRLRLRHRGSIASLSESPVLVRLPNGESRRMKPGPSSLISKAVMEEFTCRFMAEPALIFLSESGERVIQQDDRLARSIGLKIQPDRNLPDIILADIGLQTPILLFVEVVITDGAITRLRKEALLRLATEGGFPSDRTLFLSAFADRDSPVFRRLASELAWGSLAWLASEPDNLIVLYEKQGKTALDSIASPPLRG